MASFYSLNENRPHFPASPRNLPESSSPSWPEEERERQGKGKLAEGKEEEEEE